MDPCFDKNIYELELHEATLVRDGMDLCTICMKVPGGWIYNSFDKSHNLLSGVFVPYVRDNSARNGFGNNLNKGDE